MQSAGSPCPWNGKIGKDAQDMWDKYPELRPDYEEYLAKTKAIAKIDKRIIKEEQEQAEEIAKLLEEERLEEEKLVEKAKLKAKKKADEKIIIIDTIPLPIHSE
jgi:hypothetical protein